MFHIAARLSKLFFFLSIFRDCCYTVGAVRLLPFAFLSAVRTALRWSSQCVCVASGFAFVFLVCLRLCCVCMHNSRHEFFPLPSA